MWVYRWPTNVQLRWRMMISTRRSVSATRQAQARARVLLVSCWLSHYTTRSSNSNQNWPSSGRVILRLTGWSVSSRGQTSKAKKAGTSLYPSNVIDLSNDSEAHVTKPKTVMKPLPPALDLSQFPRFADGSVYIIVHPHNHAYQYQLHKAVLSRLSTPLQSLLSSQKDEVDLTLKVASTKAEVRLDLIYSPKKADWIFQKNVRYMVD